MCGNLKLWGIEMIYNTYISTMINKEQLRFKVQYSADSAKEAVRMALEEWDFPEYYDFAAIELSEDCAFEQAGMNF